MAEGILFSLAGKILEGLGSFLVQEGKLAWGVKDEIQKLEETVKTIKSVLLDAEEQHNKMKQVTDWIQRLKDAFYEADDLLDDFSTEVRRRQVMTGNKLAIEVRIFFSRFNQIAYSLRIAHEIKAIREKLNKIEKDKLSHLAERLVEKGVINIERETHSFVRAEKVMGRDDDKRNVIGLLLDSNDYENVLVVTIVGMGGVGKTTLAQLAYNDENVKNYFKLRMWVCVSNDFSVKIIVEKIIKSATRTELLGNFLLDQLQEFLRKEIDGKRYLLVLDDVWNDSHSKWNDLTNLLMNGSKGSKILVTTRSERVANVTSKLKSYVYPLKELDEKKSWSLFTQIAFKQGMEPKDSKLIELGKGIVAKCGGVPLVIMTIGPLLYDNNEEDYWLNFKDNEMSKVKEESDILPSLKLSYDHLPSNLKQCFAYCALFPKDYKIKRQKLIHLWMAQGFLQISNKECPEDVGNKYFTALLLGSFFQDPEYDRWGNVVTCKMHDLMHDLAQLVAGTECTMQTVDNVESVNERCRHLSLDCGEVKASWTFPVALCSRKNIRTLLLFCKLNWGFSLDDGEEILTSYKSLRALDFGELRFQKLLTSSGEVSSLIGKSKHLRYLNFSCVEIKVLSDSLSRLVNLETLDLSYCSELVELPRGVKKMVNLRHLINKKCDSLVGMPNGLGHLKNLQTLSLFVVSQGTKQANRKSSHGGTEELHGLNNLRGKLRIKNLQFEESSELAHLEEKQFLWSLTLDWGRSDDREVHRKDEAVLEGLKPHPNLKKISVKSFMGVKLCDWLLYLKNLTSISIKNCRRCQHIPPLDKLRSLKSLFLSHADDLEYISDEAYMSSSTLSTTFFPSLEQFTLYDCPKLKGWWRKHDYDDSELPSFPCLSKLDIQNCPSLTSTPLYPSLKEIKLLKTSSKPLQRTMTMTLMNEGKPSTSSCLSAPLSNLKSMLMCKIPDLESFPVGVMQKLTSLVDLKILLCPKNTQLDQAIKSLPSLRNWKITSHEEREPEWDNFRKMGLRYIPDFV